MNKRTLSKVSRDLLMNRSGCFDLQLASRSVSVAIVFRVGEQIEPKKRTAHIQPTKSPYERTTSALRELITFSNCKVKVMEFFEYKIFLERRHSQSYAARNKTKYIRFRVEGKNPNKINWRGWMCVSLCKMRARSLNVRAASNTCSHSPALVGACVRVCEDIECQAMVCIEMNWNDKPHARRVAPATEITNATHAPVDSYANIFISIICSDWISCDIRNDSRSWRCVCRSVREAEGGACVPATFAEGQPHLQIYKPKRPGSWSWAHYI